MRIVHHDDLIYVEDGGSSGNLAGYSGGKLLGLRNFYHRGRHRQGHRLFASPLGHAADKLVVWILHCSILDPVCIPFHAAASHTRVSDLENLLLSTEHSVQLTCQLRVA